MIKNKSPYAAVVIGVAIIALIASASLTGLFKSLNNVSYDVLLTTFSTNQASEKIIVIEGQQHYADSGDEVWLTLLNILLALDVEQIVFTFMPEKVSDSFYRLAENSNKVVFGRHVLRSNKLDATLTRLPDAAIGKAIPIGIFMTPANEHGVFRTQRYNIELDGVSHASLEHVSAERVLATKLDKDGDQFLINFTGGANRIPRLRLGKSLDNGIVSELVTGRTILIGLHNTDNIVDYFTPISPDVGQISETLYHAYSLDTLLYQRDIKPLAIELVLSLIVLITIFSIFIYQSLTFRLSLVITASLSIIYIIVCWLLLHQLSIWIPIVELIVTQWIIMAVIWRYRVIQEKETLDKMLLDLSVSTQEKVFPVSFYTVDDPWSQLITMINQTLNLNRLIFLERVVNDHRLKEIKAFNCSIDDVVELRRDYERTPYSTAISENQPIVVDAQRPYLKKIDADEIEYLAPLIFAGEIIGFWAFTVERQNVVSTKKFVALARDYMVQISEILHYRQEWQKRIEAEDNKLLKYLRIEAGRDNYQLLNQSVTLLDRRISELQDVFNHMSNASILYDLFGRVLLVNTRMEELAKSGDIQPYNMTVLDFIVELSGFDAFRIRTLLERVIFDQKAMSFPVTHFENDKEYILHVKPLRSKENESSLNQNFAEAQVFKLHGILCELVDTTALLKVGEFKEKMLERFSFQIRNDMGSVLFAVDLLGAPNISENEKAYALKTIQGKVDETITTLNLLNDQMEKDLRDIQGNDQQVHPVDSMLAIEHAVADLDDLAKSKQIKLHFQLPQLISLVFAPYAELEKVLILLLQIMIDDTYQQGDVWLTVEEKEDGVHFEFHSNGIGLTEDKLQSLLDNDANVDVDVDDTALASDIVRLRIAISQVNEWGGMLNISSEMGEGITAKLNLKRFL